MPSYATYLSLLYNVVGMAPFGLMSADMVKEVHLRSRIMGSLTLLLPVSGGFLMPMCIYE